MIERKTNAAALKFVRAGPGLYDIGLEGVPGAKGDALKATINDAFSWVFVRTDAYVLQGQIASDNKACLALVPQVPGYRLERGDLSHKFTLTLARWAQSYGLKKALSEMRAAGQSVKADKLEAAARVAGVL